MPKILFWNIARQGGGVTPLGAEELKEDLEGLAGQYKPDLIILCEGLKGLRKAMKANFEVPSGYAAPSFDKTYGNYNDQNTLRYVLMHRSGTACSAYLIGTGNDRPALAICMGGRCMIALHAPSVTGSTVPQTNQMISAFNTVSALVRQRKIPIVNDACMIFGDLNMDVGNSTKVGRLRGKLLGTGLQNFTIQKPGSPTHRNPNSGLYDTTLDWALTEPGFAPAVQVVDPGDDVSMGSGSDDDEDFVPEYGNAKNPDHKPILISW